MKKIDRSRRGQISLFVIVGLLFALMIGVAVFMRFYTVRTVGEETTERALELPTETREIEAFVRQCVRQTTYDGLTLMGSQGGYSSVSPIIRFQGTAYWHQNQVNIQPTLNQTRITLEKYIEEQLSDCLNFGVFEQQGFVILHDEPIVTVSFGTERVPVDVQLDMVITRGDVRAEISTVSEEINVRWRRIFEYATLINYKQLDAQFEFSHPLDNVPLGNFDASFDTVGGVLIYTITDRTKLEHGEQFRFTFASKFESSRLLRVTKLQDNSKTVASVFPYIVYSLDRKAQLYILPGATASLHGENVDNITVQQDYNIDAVRTEVPFSEDENNVVTRGDLTWALSYPVYNFSPSGLRFNAPQRLVLYWDEDRVPIGSWDDEGVQRQGMGILYNDGSGGWRPLPSKADYNEHFVYTDIPGFSSYTPIDCSLQPEKRVTVVSELEPDGNCVASLVVTIVIVVVILAIIVVTAGTFGVALAATFTNVLLGLASSASAIIVAAVVGTAIVGLGVIGGAYINSAQMYSAAEDTIVFTPTCDQTIEISKDTPGGSGICVPSGTAEITGPEFTQENGRTFLTKAGIPQPLQAATTKCNGGRSMWCGSCKTTCKTSYR